jgi:hypothetical protein
MIWYTGTCGIMIMNLLLYGLDPMVVDINFMFVLESNDCFVIGALYTNEVMIITLLVS